MDAKQDNRAQIEQALQVLRDRFGTRIVGDNASGIAKMRRALEDGLGISEGQADALAKQLVQNRLVIYGGEQQPAPETTTVVPLPVNGMNNAGPVGQSMTAPTAGIILNEEANTGAGILDANNDSYWEIQDPGTEPEYIQASGPVGDDYEQPGGVNSYAADLEAAGQLDDEGRNRL